MLFTGCSYSLPAGKVILPPVMPIITATVTMFLWGSRLAAYYFLLLFYTKDSTLIWAHWETNQHKNPSIILAFILIPRSDKAMQSHKWKAMIVIKFCTTKVPRTAWRQTMWEAEMLFQIPDLVWLNFASPPKARAGMQQEKKHTHRRLWEIPAMGSMSVLTPQECTCRIFHDCHDDNFR